MNIYKKYAPIYRNATVLLRPRTPLKDMYLALDPGTKSAGAVPNGGSLTAAQTNPDVDVSQILSSLDADTRNYLILLLAGGAQAFRDHGATGAAPSRNAVADLRGTFKRFEPLNRDTLTLTHLLAARQSNLRRSIHNLNLVANSLGGVDTQLASLISLVGHELLGDLRQRRSARVRPCRCSRARCARPRRRSARSRRSRRRAPPTLHRACSRSRATSGRRCAAARPLFRDTTPVIKNQLRPFSVAVQPLARTLAPASATLSQAIPALSQFDRRPQ